ncbi:MAG: cell division protein FtsQ/DivIB [Pyrinomonadaceae bacterium]
MREQVIPQKVGNRTGIAARRRSGSLAQRPLRRDRENAGRTLSARMRAMLSYVPVLLRLALAIAVGGLLFAGYRAAVAASFFQLRKVEIQGNARTSNEDVQNLVQRSVGNAGVWQADLKQIGARLERLPWIRVAMVSRVLPDGIRVRILERQPRAVVRTSSGRFLWVDEDAVLLGEMLPTDQMPPFFLRGWNEEEGETARKENSERIKRFLTLEQDWIGAGLAERVSEVNLIDIRDVRAQLAGDDSQIEIRLGSQDFRKRLQNALNVLDEHRQTPRGPFISYVDISQGKRAVIGFMSGAHTFSDSVDSSARPSPGETRRGETTVRRSQASTATAARNDKTPRKREAKASRND